MSKYDDIKSGKDRPKVIDELHQYAKKVGMDHGPLHPFARQITNAADQLDRQWREHTLQQHIEGLEVISEVYKEERDSARRMVCLNLSGSSRFKFVGFDHMTPQQIADHFNWHDSPQPPPDDEVNDMEAAAHEEMFEYYAGDAEFSVENDMQFEINSLKNKIEQMEKELQVYRNLKSEMNVRIEYGAQSGGHLEALRDLVNRWEKEVG